MLNKPIKSKLRTICLAQSLHPGSYNNTHLFFDMAGLDTTVADIDQYIPSGVDECIVIACNLNDGMQPRII